MNSKSAIMTVGGTFFDPLSPRAVDVNLRTIAHALGRIVRFNGHTRRPITVAEHSLRVERITARLGGSLRSRLFALLHDSAEAFIGDIVRPIKTDDMRATEDRVLASILEAVFSLYGIRTAGARSPSTWIGSFQSEDWKTVREADEIALFFEAMLEQPGAEKWAPDLLDRRSEYPGLALVDVWRFLPDIAPRSIDPIQVWDTRGQSGMAGAGEPGADWFVEVDRLARMIAARPDMPDMP